MSCKGELRPVVRIFFFFFFFFPHPASFSPPLIGAEGGPVAVFSPLSVEEQARSSLKSVFP